MGAKELVMPELSFRGYVQQVERTHLNYPTLRQGQLHWMVLLSVRPDLAKLISHTRRDPYELGVSKLHPYLHWIEENW